MKVSARKSRVIALGLLMSAALVTTACGNSSNDTDGGTSSESSGTSYPEKQIDIVVPFSAGGPTDTVTRLVADPMGKDLGQTIVVKNVPGPGGTVGTREVANADPDGYTLLLYHIGMSTTPRLYENKNLGYDPLTDFAPVGLVTNVPMTIITRKDLGVTDLQGLIDYLKENPDATYGHAGIGSASNLCGTLFKKDAGVEFRAIPQEGTAEVKKNLLGGKIDFSCDQTTNTSEIIASGDVTALAVTTPERVDTPALKDIPTAQEEGLDMDLSIWHALYAPAGTPDDVISVLQDALKKSLADENVISKFGELGTAPVPDDQVSPEAVTTLLTDQIAQWNELLEPIE